MVDKTSFFTEVLQLTNEAILQKFCDAAAIKTFKKGELVTKRGEFQSDLFFLIDGILRGFFGNEKGKEATECFIFRYGQPAVGSYRLDNVPDVGIIAETDATCMKISKSKTQELLIQYPELLYAYNELLIIEMEEQQNIKNAMYMFDAKERYQWFLENYDGLMDRVSHKHVASFLNITPVTLSRLRRAEKQRSELIDPALQVNRQNQEF